MPRRVHDKTAAGNANGGHLFNPRDHDGRCRIVVHRPQVFPRRERRLEVPGGLRPGRQPSVPDPLHVPPLRRHTAGRSTEKVRGPSDIGSSRIDPRNATVTRSARRDTTTASDAARQVAEVDSQTAGQRGSAWGIKPSDSEAT